MKKNINNRQLLIVLVLCVISTKLYTQTEYPAESENDIYWQPHTQIDFSDYQSKSDTNCIKYNEKYGTQTSASIGFREVVDIPKRRGKLDKLYLTPVFCKNCSCILSEDSLSLKVDRLLFDMTETFARLIRRDLFELQKEMNTNNVNSMFFTSVKNQWEEKMRSFFGTVIIDVFIEKKDSAYIKWRQNVDNVLQELEPYATQPEDCYRFIIQEPIMKGYKKAETIMGDMWTKKETEE